MNSKVTLNQLAESIAKATGSNAQTAKAFIQDLTEIITEALSKGKSITIKGLGTFTASEGNVLWHPDDTLAENVNQPFAAFEPVELGDGVTEEILDGDIDNAPASTDNETEEESAMPEEAAMEYHEIHSQETEQTEATDNATEEQTTADDIAVISEADHPESTAGTKEPTPDCEPDITPEPVRRPYLNPWMMLITGILAGFIIGYFSAPYITGMLPYCNIGTSKDTPDTVVTEPDARLEPITIDIDTVSAPADTLSEDTSTKVAETIEKPEIITDTISAHRYLTTMSRKYYGDYRFWVYIYLENSDIISDPNRIKPGTVVVIPPAEKYGIDPTDHESVADANEKIRAILEKLDK